MNKGNKRTCPEGHTYYKSSACLACPVCAADSKPSEGLLSTLPAPARRALESLGITTATGLAQYSKKEIMALHGMGPASLPKMEQALRSEGLAFRQDKADT